MKTFIRFLIVCLLSMIMIQAYSQNRYWVFPPNYIDLYTGQVLPLPNTAINPATTVDFSDLVAGTSSTVSGAPLNKNSDYTHTGYRSSNGLFDSEGELKFYLNNKAYVTSGKTVVYAPTYNNKLPIIPVPGECDKYFLLTGKATGSGNTYLYYKEIDQGVTSVVNKTLTIPTLAYNDILYDVFSFAPMTINPVTDEPEIKMYNVSGNVVTEIFINNDGLHYSRYWTLFGIDGGYLGEAELSNDGQLLAWSHPQLRSIFVLNIQTSLAVQYRVNTCATLGLEFSPDSNDIFLAYHNIQPASLCSPTINKIGRFNLNAGTFSGSNGILTVRELSTSEIQFMPNSENLGSSFIEYAVDGLMYVSNGASLIGFDPANIIKGVIKSYAISNPVSSSPVFGANLFQYYTLVDQIDRVDHTRIFQIGCETSKTISNVTSSNGTLEPITKVSQLIEAANSVTVAPGTSVTFKAGDQISLKPGFVVSAGGKFRGRLEDCDDLMVDYCEGGARIGKIKRIEEENFYIHVFPNTTRGIINVKTNRSTRISRLEVLAADGKVLLKKSIAGVQEITLNLSEFVNGLYILQIVHMNGVERRRIVVNK